MRSRSRLAVWLLALPLVGAASPSVPASDGAAWFRALSRHARAELVVAHPELVAAADRAARRATELGPRSVERVEPGQANGAIPRVVVGLLEEPWIAELAGELDLVSAGRGEPSVSVFGRPYPHDSTVVVATLADPAREGLPLTLVLGASAAHVAQRLGDARPRWRPGLTVWRQGDLALRLPIEDGAARWSLAEDLLQRRLAADPGSPPVHLGHVSLRADPGVAADRLESYGTLLARVRARLQAALELPRSAVSIEVRAVAHAEDLRRHHGFDRLSRVYPEEPGRALTLLAANLPHDGGACAARAFALQRLGPPSAPWLLDAVGAAFAETWWGWPMEQWVAHLHRAGHRPTPAELMSGTADQRWSPHVLVPLRGVLWHHMAAKLGSSGMQSLWSGGAIDPEVDPDTGFEEHLDRLVELAGGRVAERLAERRTAATAQPWRGGVHLTVDRGDPQSALTSRRLAASLNQARERGVGAVALTPLVYVEPRDASFPGLDPAPFPDAVPTDLALGAAAGEARLRGMEVMLAPQVLATGGGSWIEQHPLATTEATDAAFGRYRAVLEHYALLGELLDAQVLCLGSGRRGLSRTRALPEDDPADQPHAARLAAAWSGCIAELRRSFAGALTYGAGSAYEAVRIGFWGELDYVGVDFFPGAYYPRAGADPEDFRDPLERQLEPYLDLARDVGRPLLLTQVGFASRAADAAPSAPRRAEDLEGQRVLYEALDRVLDDLEGHPLAGLYLWNWDPDPRAGGPGHAGYTPQGKPALAALTELLTP